MADKRKSAYNPPGTGPPLSLPDTGYPVLSSCSSPSQPKSYALATPARSPNFLEILIDLSYDHCQELVKEGLELVMYQKQNYAKFPAIPSTSSSKPGSFP
jgi:hypothetical protein